RVTYCLEGAVFVAGAVVQWLRDGLGLIKSSQEIETLAASVPDAGGVLIVPAFVGLGAPYWDPHARGTISGITRGTSAGHFARAAVESMAYQTRDLITAMEKDAGVQLRTLKVDGGASVNNGLLQFQADILGAEVHRPVVSETTALGAAYLAGLAVGYWSDADDVRSNWRLESAFRPQMDRGERETRYANWQKAVSRSLAWETA
ncbi:MAG: FGGY family carbohydrate kinase, partial [Pirellulaceae bacterium]